MALPGKGRAVPDLMRPLFGNGEDVASLKAMQGRRRPEPAARRL